MNSDYINNSNITNIRHEIEKKKSSFPYFATSAESISVITDHDSFPYPRWYRGVPTSSNPIISEREAGWRQRNDNCYKISNVNCKKQPYPQHCFSSGCSVVFPCVPHKLDNYRDKELFDVILNNNYISQQP